jgi:hypothetical protein
MTATTPPPAIVIAYGFSDAHLAAAESRPALIPTAQPGLFAALCFSLLHGPGDVEAW